MAKPAKLRRFNEYSTRDLLVVGIPLLLVVAAGFWVASRFIQPAPPDVLILSSGADGGAYQRFAAAYKDVFARYDIRLVEKPSAGSTENLKRLRDENFEVDAAFVQGGTARVQEDDTLLSLGGLYYEPLWIFYRADLERGKPLQQVADLKGKRVAIGAPGSGSRYLAQEMLYANQLDAGNTKLSEAGGLGLIAAFSGNEIDAAFVVGPTQSAAVWVLLSTPGIKVMSLTHVDAYTRRFPYLSKVVLPRGAIDVAGDRPAQDITLLASTATLVVREDTHPALVNLLMQAMSETHGGPGMLQRPGEFPRATGVDFPLSKEAEHFYKSGKPFLQRYLPFWAATLVDRLVVMLIPLLAVLIPVVKVAPALYTWRVRSRIFRRYGELKFIEAEVEADPGRHTREEWLKRVDAIEQDANRLQTPLAYSDMLYTLRTHIALVRETVLRHTPQ
jgi:TRAP transporter TAXI family solute receptor